MKLIYNPFINRLLRSICQPVKSLIPKKLHFPVTGKVRVDLPEGKSFLFSGNITSPHMREMYWYGIKGFEYSSFPLFVHLIKQCNCFFDIGANLGYYTLVAGSYNTKAIIHCFEPLPGAFRYLTDNIHLNELKNVVANQMALSDTNGEAVFYSYKNPKFPYISDHLRGDSSLAINSYSQGERIEFKIQTQRLDDYVDEYLKENNKIDLLKIDTEGTEDRVFAGAERVLSYHRPVIMCEIIKGGIEDKVDQMLRQKKYIFYLISEKGLIFKESLNPEAVKEDYLMVPEEKAEIIRKFIKN